MVQCVEDRLVKAIRKQAEKVNYYCSAENVTPDLAIHEIRKSFKRIRALLKFYPKYDHPDTQELVSRIKSQGKILSPLRESHVNVQIFQNMIRQDKMFEDDKFTELEASLLNEHNKLVETSMQDRKIVVEILSVIYEVEKKILDWKLQTTQNIDLRKQISLNYECAYSLFSGKSSIGETTDLHDLRKLLKVLMYQIEFIKNHQPRFFKLKYNELRKLTEQLGEIHDWFVFIDDIQTKKYKIKEESQELVQQYLLKQCHSKYHKSVRRIGKFFADSPVEFKELVFSNYEDPQIKSAAH